MIRQVPVRWRLTLWNAAIISFVLLLFCVAIYLGQRFLLYDNYDEQALEQVRIAQSAMVVTPGHVSLAPATVTSLSDNEHFVRLFDMDGQELIDTSPAIGSIPIDRDMVAQALAGTDQRRTILHANDQSFVLWTVPVRHNGTVVGVLQTGSSRSDADEILHLQLIAMLTAAPLVLVAALAGGYLLAARALRPVDEITRLADSIGGHDLHSRLGLHLPNDELGRLARTFDNMLARIEDAFERQRRFTGDAAHELRTPLSMMQGQVDLATARQRSPSEYHQAFVELNEDLGRLTRLTETLLALSRADGQGIRLDLSPLDAADTIGLVADQYLAEASLANVAIVVESRPTPMLADPDLLIQLLVNLVDNALAFTPAGGTIRLGCRPTPAGGCLQVRDSGEGIASDQLEHVFDRFYRVDAARARSHGGAGLGLAICKSIVEAHHGTIAIASQPGDGTTVTVIIPRRAAVPSS